MLAEERETEQVLRTCGGPCSSSGLGRLARDATRHDGGQWPRRARLDGGSSTVLSSEFWHPSVDSTRLTDMSVSQQGEVACFDSTQRKPAIDERR